MEEAGTATASVNAPVDGSSDAEESQKLVS